MRDRRASLALAAALALIVGAMLTSPSARAMPGAGVVHACSTECAAQRPFVWEPVWS